MALFGNQGNDLGDSIAMHHAHFHFIIRRLAAVSHASRPPAITITVFSTSAISRNASAQRTGAQINTSEIHTGDWRPHRAAPHRQTCFVESMLSPFPSTAKRRSIIELLYDGGEAGFDFVRNDQR